MKVYRRAENLTPPPKNPITDGHQNLCRWLCRGYLPPSKIFIKIGLGVSVLRMRDFAPLGTKWLGYFLGVLEKGYSLDARTDFDAKYVKRRGSAQGSAFFGVAKYYVISRVYGPWTLVNSLLFSPVSPPPTTVALVKSTTSVDAIRLECCDLEPENRLSPQTDCL